MKTNEELERAIQNLIARMNRVEALQAKQAPDPKKIVIDLDASAVSRCIAQLEASLRDIEARKLVTFNGK